MSTERQTEQAAVDFGAFFTLSVDMLCIAGFDGHFKHVNPAWERTLGWTADELTSRPWSEFVHPHDLESTISEAQKQTELGLETISFENRYRCKDGSYRWLVWNSRPCPERSEMLAIARDVTEQRQTQEALIELNATLEAKVAERTAAAVERAAQAERVQEQLRQTEEQVRTGADRMRSFLQQMPLSIALIDTAMRYWFVSDRFSEDYGLARDEAIGALHTELFPGDPEKWRTVYARCEGGETEQCDEEEFTLRDGRREWLRWRADPWKAPNGEIRGMLFYSEIVTARKQAEKLVVETTVDLTRSNAEMEAFTYSVSHDLKEPLRTIEAFSQFLLEDYAELLDEQGKDYLQKLAKASARMKQLIEDLLALSRIGRRHDEMSVTDTNRVVSDVAEGMRVSIAERSASVVASPDLPPVLGDAARLEQIFGNLISNGLKFNRSDRPRVEIGVRSGSADVVTFFVRDNGIGISGEYHERIFGIFQRLHRREEFEGTGAGLAIVKRAVEALGGQISVESDGASGTTFVFTLASATHAFEQAAA